MVDQPDNNAFTTDQATENAFQNIGKAPAMPADAPQMAQVASGPVNVIDPTGDLVSIPGEHLQNALGQGYRQATDQDIHDYMRHQKYGTGAQQAITGLEGAGQGATFGLSTKVETALGVNPEDIRERAEENPISHGAGQVAGLVGSSFIPGVGEANLLGHAGEGAAAAIGLGAEKAIAEAGAKAASEGALQGLTGTALSDAVKAAKDSVSAGFSPISRIGSAAVKGAAENALFAGSDEVSKYFTNDPEQDVSSAVANVGLSGLLGGALSGGVGGAGELWKATLGRELSGKLGAIRDAVGGKDGAPLPDHLTDALQTYEDTSGQKLDPQIKASLTRDPYVRQLSQQLQDSASGGGVEHQNAITTFKNNISDAISGVVGRSPEDVKDLNPHDVGDSIKSIIKDKITALNDPLNQQYEAISNRFKQAEIPLETKQLLSENLGKLVLDGASPESAQAKLLQRVLKETGGLNNLEQLRNYGSSLSQETSGLGNQHLWGVSRDIKNALNDAMEDTLTRTVGEQAPELSGALKAANKGYRELKNTISDLNDRLKVGPHAGPKTFLSALDGQDGEAVLRKLNPANRADVIDELKSFSPEAAQKVQDYHLSDLVKRSSKMSPEGLKLDVNAFNKKLNGLSPQFRSFLISPEAEQKITGLQALANNLPEKIGKSGTPQGLDGIARHALSAPLAMIAALTGHNPITGALIGSLNTTLGRDLPDAARISLLKFLGSPAEISAPGFKAAVELAHSTIQGTSALSKGSKAIFKAGKLVLPESMMPTDKDRTRLEKQLKGLQVDQTPLTNVATDASHYMPEHGQAMGALSANAVNYLNSLKPATDKPFPLDAKTIPSPAAKAKYDSALNIAEQPLSVLPKIKQGNLTPEDVTHLKTMYPALYSKMTQQLLGDMSDHINKGQAVPYQTRLGLSLFAGQPLDSTMTQTGIMSAQPIPKPPLPVSNTKATALGKMSKGMRTQSDSASADREDRS